MSQDKYIITPSCFKHITEIEQYQIEILLKEKRKPSEIARTLGKDKRTIEREMDPWHG